MAYPTFTANGASTIRNGLADVSYPLPAHQAGDILFLVVETAAEATSGLTFTAGTGWTAVTGTPVVNGAAGGTSSTALFIYWKRATSSSETAPTIADVGNHQAGNTFGVRGCIATGSPFDQISNSATGTTSSASIPALNANAAYDSIFFDVIATGADIGSAQATFGAPNGNVISQSEAFDGASSNGNGGGVAYAWGYQGTPAFGLGATSVTLAVANSWAGIKFSLKPEPRYQGAQARSARYLGVRTDANLDLGRVYMGWA